jgi:hypothetical protein
MEDDASRQRVVDDVHLKVLSLAYKVTAGLAAFFSLFGLLYAGFAGVMFIMLARMPNQRGDAPPPELGWIFGCFGLLAFGIMIALAALNWHVGRCLDRRRSRTFCYVMAVLTCLNVGYGTAIGVCTFLVLGRPSVAALFRSQEALPPRV